MKQIYPKADMEAPQGKSMPRAAAFHKKAARIQAKTAPYLYLAPCLALVALFVYFPLINTVSLSLTRTNAMGEPVRFVWFQNYIDVICSPEFLNSCVVILKFVVLTAVPAFILGLVLALLTEKRGRGNGLFELLFSMPVVISSSSGAMIWMLMLNPSTGFISFLLNQKVNYFQDERFAIFALAALTVWLSVGINYIFFLTALRNVPGSISEAACLDGAGFFCRLFQITLPMISPTLFFVAVMDVAAFAQTFTQIAILTRGGPTQSTNTLVYSIYNDAFINDRYDIASVQSILLFLIMLAAILLQFRMEKKVVYDS